MYTTYTPASFLRFGVLGNALTPTRCSLAQALTPARCSCACTDPVNTSMGLGYVDGCGGFANAGRRLSTRASASAEAGILQVYPTSASARGMRASRASQHIPGSFPARAGGIVADECTVKTVSGQNEEGWCWVCTSVHVADPTLHHVLASCASADLRTLKNNVSQHTNGRDVGETCLARGGESPCPFELGSCYRASVARCMHGASEKRGRRCTACLPANTVLEEACGIGDDGNTPGQALAWVHGIATAALAHDGARGAFGAKKQETSRSAQRRLAVSGMKSRACAGVTTDMCTLPRAAGALIVELALLHHGLAALAHHVLRTARAAIAALRAPELELHGGREEVGRPTRTSRIRICAELEGGWSQVLLHTRLRSCTPSPSRAEHRRPQLHTPREAHIRAHDVHAASHVSHSTAHAYQGHLCRVGGGAGVQRLKELKKKKAPPAAHAARGANSRPQNEHGFGCIPVIVFRGQRAGLCLMRVIAVFACREAQPLCLRSKDTARLGQRLSGDFASMRVQVGAREPLGCQQDALATLRVWVATGRMAGCAYAVKNGGCGKTPQQLGASKRAGENLQWI
ncbi:hypothetical protein B0H10DRAFT_1944583 [Mycena sp. CBHHK59/15]|nr:hypothetical protein B0H10DRAFT_1944583 [Mycena sp. CBHHK59/15]